MGPIEQEIIISDKAIIRGSSVAILDERSIIEEIRVNNNPRYIDRIGDNSRPFILTVTMLYVIMFFAFSLLNYNLLNNSMSFVFGLFQTMAMISIFLVVRYRDRQKAMKQYLLKQYSSSK